MIIKLKNDWKTWVKIIFGIDLNKSNFGKLMDMIFVIGTLLIGSYLWFVEKPKLELYKTCNELIAKQWKDKYNISIDWDENMSWENLSVSCPCLSSIDEVIK